jgi:hypothetical protein
MRGDYLKLSDGRQVRVEWNTNALATYNSITGTDLTDLVNARNDAKTLRLIAWCSVIEGEDADGKQLELSEMELGRLMNMDCIVKFSEILARQSGLEFKSKEPLDSARGEKKKPPMRMQNIFARRRH